MGVATYSTVRRAIEEAMVSVRAVDGSTVERPLGRVRADHVVRSMPWRTVRNRAGQKHHSGFYWCATTGGHVVYESRLELARLTLADFDPWVVAISAQPFRISARIDGRVRRHVPDFLLVARDRSVTVVNVKPASQLERPEVAEALAWPARLFEEHGWSHEIWTGDNPVFLANVGFLAGQRREYLVPREVTDAVLAAAARGLTIRELMFRLGGSFEPKTIKPAIVRLLWQQRLVADLRVRLDSDSTVVVAA